MRKSQISGLMVLIVGIHCLMAVSAFSFPRPRPRLGQSKKSPNPSQSTNDSKPQPIGVSISGQLTLAGPSDSGQSKDKKGQPSYHVGINPLGRGDSLTFNVTSGVATEILRLAAERVGVTTVLLTEPLGTTPLNFSDDNVPLEQIPSYVAARLSANIIKLKASPVPDVSERLSVNSRNLANIVQYIWDDYRILWMLQGRIKSLQATKGQPKTKKSKNSGSQTATQGSAATQKLIEAINDKISALKKRIQDNQSKKAELVLEGYRLKYPSIWVVSQAAGPVASGGIRAWSTSIINGHPQYLVQANNASSELFVQIVKALGATGEDYLTRYGATINLTSPILVGNNQSSVDRQVLDRIDYTTTWPLTFVSKPPIIGVNPGVLTAQSKSSAEIVADLINKIEGTNSIENKSTDKLSSVTVNVNELTTQSSDKSIPIAAKPIPKVVASSHGTDVILSGEKQEVDRLKRIIATYIDIPYDQVRIDAYQFQSVSDDSSRNKSDDNSLALEQGISIASQFEKMIMNRLTRYIQSRDQYDQGKDKYNNLIPDSLKTNNSKIYLPLQVNNFESLLKLAGFDTNRNRDLSLVDILTFLLMDNTKPEAFDEEGLVHAMCCAQSDFTNAYGDLALSLADMDDRGKRPLDPIAILCGRYICSFIDCSADYGLRLNEAIESKKAGDFKKNLEEVLGHFDKLNKLSHLLKHLSISYSQSNLEAVRASLAEFLAYWVGTSHYKEVVELIEKGDTSHGDPYGDLPIDSILWKSAIDPKQWNYLVEHTDLAGRLSNASALIDSNLKSAAASLAEDLKEDCMAPLLQWERNSFDTAAGDAISFNGNSSVSVTSGQIGNLGSTVTINVPFTEEQTLKNILNNAQNLTGGSEVADLLGSGAVAIKALSGLATSAITSAPSTQISQFGPNLTLTVRPTVYRNGNSVRLEISVVNGITPARNAGNADTHFDRVSTESILSDVSADALELFSLGSMTYDISAPASRSNGFLGSALGGVRHYQKKLHAKTMIILQVVIIPRSLDLAGKFLN